MSHKHHEHDHPPTRQAHEQACHILSLLSGGPRQGQAPSKAPTLFLCLLYNGASVLRPPCTSCRGENQANNQNTCRVGGWRKICADRLSQNGHGHIMVQSCAEVSRTHPPARSNLFVTSTSLLYVPSHKHHEHDHPPTRQAHEQACHILSLLSGGPRQGQAPSKAPHYSALAGRPGGGGRR